MSEINWINKIWLWIAWHLPKKLAKWASVRVMSNDTGIYQENDTLHSQLAVAQKQLEMAKDAIKLAIPYMRIESEDYWMLKDALAEIEEIK
jgi:hypothetical protein